MTNPKETYEKIKRRGSEAKAAADAFMNELARKYTPENPAPQAEIQKGLEDILTKHSANSGIEAKTTSKLPYAAGLFLVLATVAVFASGIPYTPTIY